MDFFFFKLCFTPLIIIGATLAARRWGAAIGGLIAGLPLTSGPVSVFLALEQGARFATEAACGSLLSIPPLTLFAFIYQRLAFRFVWTATLFFALAAYILSFWVFSFITLPVFPAFFLVVSLLAVILRFGMRSGKAVERKPAPWWDLPLRVAITTILVFAITAAAGRAGAMLSGMLACFPVLICIMTVFTHIDVGIDGVQQFLYGSVMACFSFAVFYLVVALCLPHLSLVASYMLALLAIAASGQVTLGVLSKVA